MSGALQMAYHVTYGERKRLIRCDKYNLLNNIKLDFGISTKSADLGLQLFVQDFEDFVDIFDVNELPEKAYR